MKNKDVDEIVVSYNFINDIKSIIKSFSVFSEDKEKNKIITYWKVGERILEEEKFLEWNKVKLSQIIVYLANHIKGDFKMGFYEANIRKICAFYKAFNNYYFLIGNLCGVTWKHIQLLIKIPNEAERSFYLKCTSRNLWNLVTLKNKIDKNYYLLVQELDKDRQIEQLKIKYGKNSFYDDKVDKRLIKYLEHITEREKLKAQILENSEMYFLNMDKGLAFVGFPKEVITPAGTASMDLAFYNFKLKCFVFLKIITCNISEEEIDKSEYYPKYYNSLMGNKEDNPSVNIIISLDTWKNMVYISNIDSITRSLYFDYIINIPSGYDIISFIKEQQMLFLDKIVKDL